MRLKFTLALFLSLFCQLLIAKPVDQETAQKVASRFFTSRINMPLEVQLTERAGTSDAAYYYVFTLENRKGFVIVAGDDASIPLMAYSLEADYATDKVSPSYKQWMEWYRTQIIEIRTQDLKADASIAAQWEYYLNPPANEPLPVTHAVSPLLSTTWNQSPYYNAL